MTMALCFNCGAIKFGAIIPCPKCYFHMIGNMESMDDVGLAIAFSDHNFEIETLEELDLLPRLEIMRYNLKHFVECVRNGVGPSFDAETSTACVSWVT